MSSASEYEADKVKKPPRKRVKKNPVPVEPPTPDGVTEMINTTTDLQNEEDQDQKIRCSLGLTNEEEKKEEVCPVVKFADSDHPDLLDLGSSSSCSPTHLAGLEPFSEYQRVVVARPGRRLTSTPDQDGEYTIRPSVQEDGSRRDDETDRLATEDLEQAFFDQSGDAQPDGEQVVDTVDERVCPNEGSSVSVRISAPENTPPLASVPTTVGLSAAASSTARKPKQTISDLLRKRARALL